MKFFIFLFLFFTLLESHQLRENYLQIHYNDGTQTLKLTLEIETRLLENEDIFDENKNGIISFKELSEHKEYLLSYTKKHITFQNNSKPLILNDAQVLFHRYQDQTYMQLIKYFKIQNPNMLVLKYNMFFELEDTHKLIIHFEDKQDSILHSRLKEYHFSSIKMSTLQRLVLFIKSGISHILDGFDHLLFVLMILIPTVFKGIKFSLLHILKIITVFSLSHSITLFISASGVFHPNIMFIESSIALSIFIVALLNFLGKYNHVNKKIVFLFGLLHGFGFANVLEIAKIDTTFAFIISLFGFNFGVELGQIFVIFLLLPILYLFSLSKYKNIFIKTITLSSLLVSLFWFLERVNLL